jgi:hypothetical protein
MLPRNFASVLMRAVLMRRSLGNFEPPPVFGENHRLAHLFMICSNIKLTAPTESIDLAPQAIRQ